jgi:phosphopantothenoylcysteine decarboxylase/phosphopantothenate--cysteine ligase
MNREMWGNPATRRNVALLTGDGVGVLGPASGEQACGEVGDGRMLEPAEIVEELAAHFQPKTLRGRKVLLTAGPTFEAIDPVRGITNLSSGRMGLAVARAAREAGAEVTLVCGPVALPAPRGVARIDVTGALEMYAQVMSRAAANDVFIAVAAVSDYRPRTASDRKIKKDGNLPQAIDLVENPDILAEVAALPRPPLCVGFAAETQNLSEYAERKRRAKKIPLIVGNLIQDGFGGEANTLVLFDDGGQEALEPAPKLALARRLIARIATLLETWHVSR